MRTQLFIGAAAVAVALGLASCSVSSGGTSPTPSAGTFMVTSDDFDDGGGIPAVNTATAFDGQCTGENQPLSLAWTGAPAGTAAYAITMIDVDAGQYAHWLLADISGSVVRVGEGDLAGAIQGRNDNGTLGYFGPCPPGPEHHYVITIYALDQMLDLAPGYQYEEFLKASIGHTVATATLTGTRSGPA